MIRSIEEEGYSWVEISPDELWLEAQIFTYINGMDVT